MLLICGTVLCLTCVSFYVYEYVTVKRNSQKQLSVIGNIIATNSTAALAFKDQDAAREILASLRAQPRITAAALYTEDGNLFIRYSANVSDTLVPDKAGTGHTFQTSYLDDFEPVVQNGKKLGTLYIRSDMKVFHDRMKLLLILAISLLIVSLIIASFLAHKFQRSISAPILDLVDTSKAVSDRHDYALRAEKYGNDELGSLTDAFNDMLSQIETQRAEIVSFNQQLEQKVAVRTNELEQANRELESFSYSVSHDLRAPLRRISSFINMIKTRVNGKLDEESSALLDRVTANSDKMGRLIDDLLAFARIGRMQLEKKVVSMNRIVKDASDEISRQEAGHNIQFTIHPLPEVLADPAAITQVWENLISNAVKYSANKEVALIEIGSQSRAADIVYFVKDNGSGFDMEHYHKLFTAFERLHSNQEFEGTGVGLAIVQRIVEKHGGRIWAESKKGEGAAFYFSLPK